MIELQQRFVSEGAVRPLELEALRRIVSGPVLQPGCQGNDSARQCRRARSAFRVVVCSRCRSIIDFTDMPAVVETGLSRDEKKAIRAAEHDYRFATRK